MKVYVVEHDVKWSDAFEAAALEMWQVMGKCIIRVHHIGSTAIPGICAKPIIDLMPEVTDIDAVDQFNDDMSEIGYEAMGELGIPGRRYFRRNNNDGLRTHNVHAFATGTDGIRRHLVFRDFMRAHAEFAREYGELKRKLAHAHPDDIYAYMDGKDTFIKDMEARALNWASSANPKSE